MLLLRRSDRSKRRGRSKRNCRRSVLDVRSLRRAGALLTRLERSGANAVSFQPVRQRPATDAKKTRSLRLITAVLFQRLLYHSLFDGVQGHTLLGQIGWQFFLAGSEIGRA